MAERGLRVDVITVENTYILRVLGVIARTFVILRTQQHAHKRTAFVTRFSAAQAMAEKIQYPAGVAVDLLMDDPSAVAAQVQSVAEKIPGRLREFTFGAARAVAREHCNHSEEPQALPDGLNTAQKMEIASTHDGLCGVFHANAIAEVVTEGVAARGELTGNRYRNQGRLSPKMTLFSFETFSVVKLLTVRTDEDSLVA